MTESKKIDRRSALKIVGTGGIAAMAAGAIGQDDADRSERRSRYMAQRKELLNFKNEQFYKGGKFDEDAGKDAIISLMRYHRFPVADDAKEKIWVSDYNTGQFTKLGLAAILHVNNVKDRYMLMDLFLLPGQMLPEHWHLEGEGNPAKLEGWLIRHGLSYVVGEGEPNLPKEIVIPKCHCKGTATTSHCVVATPSVFVPLVKVKTRHWQWGGPEGAIISEVANVHTDSAVRHSDKKINDFFLNPTA